MRSEAMEFFTSSLNKILSKYDNTFLVGDLSVDELRLCSDSSKNHFFDIQDAFSLRNLIKQPTCLKSQNSTLHDLILTNTLITFMKF